MKNPREGMNAYRGKQPRDLGWIVLGLWFTIHPLLGAGSPDGGAKAGVERVVDSQQVIEKDWTIPPGTKLILRPGVSLRFKPGIGILSQGKVEAVGTREKPILFTEAEKGKGWANVALVGAGAQGSRFEWCRFDGGTGCIPDMNEAGELKGIQPRTAGSKAEELVGGALFLWGVEKAEVRFCRFENNSGYWGGAILCWGKSEPLITQNLFTGNRGGEDAGAIHCVKGANAHIVGNLIRNNSAKYGGGVHCLQSAAFIQENWIEGNSAKTGGGISCWNARPKVEGNFISGNSAQSGGAGLSAAGNSLVTLTKNWIGENKDPSGVGQGLLTHQGEHRKGLKDTSKIVEENVESRESVLAKLKEKGIANLSELLK